MTTRMADEALRILRPLSAVIDKPLELVDGGAASDAITLGHGGVSLVSRACGLSRKAIAKGIKEIRHGVVLPVGRMRRPGAGR